MRSFFTLIVVLLAGTAYGQSNLPACHDKDESKWDTRIEAKSISSAVIENQQKNTQINTLSIEAAKIKCSELGFKPETEGFGKCALLLTR